MKNINTVIFILLSILGKLVDASELKKQPSTEAPSQEETVEKLNYNLLSSLLIKGSTSLKDRAYCESFVKSGHDTVARFISWSLSFYHRGKDNSISSECNDSKGRTECSVNFAADSKGESPWSCGLRFKYDSKKSKVDFKSIECIGTC